MKRIYQNDYARGPPRWKRRKPRQQQARGVSDGIYLHTDLLHTEEPINIMPYYIRV